MLAIRATAIEYLWQFQRLLPRGLIWHRGWGTYQAETLLTLMRTWSRVHNRGNDLLGDLFPCSTSELLPEWEATLGLPGDCIGELGSMQERTMAVCAKFVSRGGSSQEYFIHLAASLGYQIYIETFTPFRVQYSSVGDPLYDESWAFAWRIVVEATSTTYTYFRAGRSAIGEPLRDWGSKLLECVVEGSAPAHTVPIWTYQLDAALWDNGNTIWDNGDSIWDKAAGTWDLGDSRWDNGKTVWDKGPTP